jgi:cation:H+ antiporter
MLAHAAIIVLAVVGIYVFSHMLSGGTDAIGRRFRIRPGVRGATLDAVGSSFPELCTVLVALHAGAFDAGVGTIAGSALYNILVIPAVSVGVGGALRIQKRVVRRDGFLYVAVVVALILAIWFGPESGGESVTHALSMWEGLGGVLLYLAYVVVLIIQARPKGSGTESPPPRAADPEPRSRDELLAAWKPWRTTAFVAIGMAGIGLATHFLVYSSLAVFRVLGFSEAIAGVTLLAAATSLPDTLMSVFAVRRGDADGAVSNAFGSNSFDVLICLGLPVLVTGGIEVHWGEAWPMLFFLLGSTIMSVVFLITDWTLTRLEAAVMGAVYVLFVALALGRVL